MSISKAGKSRDKKIKFVGGPRDGDSIEWTSPSPPRDKFNYYCEERIHKYAMIITYSDDENVRCWYAHLDSISIEEHKKYPKEYD